MLHEIQYRFERLALGARLISGTALIEYDRNNWRLVRLVGLVYEYSADDGDLPVSRLTLPDGAIEAALRGIPYHVDRIAAAIGEDEVLGDI